jgi:phenylacetic acid degradation protein
MGRLVMGPGSNVQDNCVLHTFPGKEVLLEEDAHIGHSAVLHGCTVRRGALVGINAVLMDDVVVGREAFVGACSFVKAKFVVPDRTLVTGAPARVVRELTAEEIGWKAIGTREYQELAARCLSSLTLCEPLRAPEPDRKSYKPADLTPLHAIDRPK